ncbi:hypothetical protein [Staphylococcus devriesei]|uniref:hypothetical protein n=1 Tax=Staphylococcus devriesei TaxID=586733 RepID=UPI000CD085E6|nr:hypothetical protein [Staphylococcus devriesei]PNZ89471.1 hypothetical protein CD147_02830 [Staphylococcus devriesei]SUM53152.1 Uncharacterised protein [Staphylococcus devriesei]
MPRKFLVGMSYVLANSVSELVGGLLGLIPTNYQLNNTLSSVGSNQKAIGINILGVRIINLKADRKKLTVEIEKLIGDLEELKDFHEMYDNQYILQRIVEIQEEIDNTIYKVYGLKRI